MRWTKDCLEYEADPRQAERLLADLGLDGDVGSAATPGVKPLAHQVSAEKELNERDHTEYRALSARANYLSVDRPDVMFSAKEVCRFMSKPTNLSQDALTRLARF